MSNDMP